jgi:superoxide dismutase, Fe-Mn family
MTRRELLIVGGTAVAAVVLGEGGAIPSASAQTPGTPAGGPFTVPPLGYAYDALEPYIDAQTIQLHHDKHHATYVDNLNGAIAKHPDLAGKSAEELVRDLASVPEDIRTTVRNNGGGHVNHSLFWRSLARDGGGPGASLARARDAAFGSETGLGDQLTRAALSVFGSGWAWLSLDERKQLIVETTPNQDSPISVGHTPLLGIDVWEHAYYLKYQNRRADYVKAFLQVIRWSEVTTRFESARG